MRPEHRAVAAELGHGRNNAAAFGEGAVESNVHADQSRSTRYAFLASAFPPARRSTFADTLAEIA